jgi:prevent-host-death family protein
MNERAEPASETRIPATEAKATFGTLLDQVLGGGHVVITRHEVPKAVLLSYEEYTRLAGSTPSLGALEAEFDALVARLQTQAAQRGLESAFAAAPRALGKAAVRAARPVKAAARSRAERRS